LPSFRPSHYPAILAAIALYDAGLDFADALHLALSDGSDAFLTFDSRAGQNGASPSSV
jgi:predicted nucleic acid-binding protein